MSYRVGSVISACFRAKCHRRAWVPVALGAWDGIASTITEIKQMSVWQRRGNRDSVCSLAWISVLSPESRFLTLFTAHAHSHWPLVFSALSFPFFHLSKGWEETVIGCLMDLRLADCHFGQWVWATEQRYQLVTLTLQGDRVGISMWERERERLRAKYRGCSFILKFAKHIQTICSFVCPCFIQVCSWENTQGSLNTSNLY